MPVVRPDCTDDQLTMSWRFVQLSLLEQSFIGIVCGLRNTFGVNYKGYSKGYRFIKSYRGRGWEGSGHGFLSVPVEMGLLPSSHVEIFTNLEVLQIPCFRDWGKAWLVIKLFIFLSSLEYWDGDRNPMCLAMVFSGTQHWSRSPSGVASEWKLSSLHKKFQKVWEFWVKSFYNSGN